MTQLENAATAAAYTRLAGLDSLSLSRRSLLRWAAAAGGVATIGSLAGCATPTGLPGPDTMTIGLNRSLVSLDNKLNQFDAAVTVQRAVRQALTRIGSDLTPELVLAERFELTAPTRWTVRIRPEAVYSDGTPVAVQDVATALEMYRTTAGSFLATFFPEWPRVVPVDAHTFLLETDKPVPILDYLMANILITPAAANKAEELQSGIGSGPYTVAAANRGTGNYTLKANPRYWGTKPGIDTVQVRFLPEESSRVVSLRSGEVDVIDSISPDVVDQLRGLPGVAIETIAGVRISQLFYNFRKPAGHPLADVRVRQALSSAIDGAALAGDVLAGSVTEADGVVPARLTGAASVGHYAYDPDKARSTLKALGVTDLELTIIWESGEFASDTQVMEAVYEMLRAVGVKPKLKQFEPGGDISTWRQGRAGDWDVLGNGFSSPTGLALTMLQGMYAGTAKKEETRDTYHGYIVPAITAEIAAASSEVDGHKRQAILDAAQQNIWNTWPCMWSFAPKSIVARRDRVENLVLEPINSYELAATRMKG
ncbi:ABC transporter substrate-binding protein [Pengzhenrongella sp.]|jgi:peptide/nickel transport system substrate-binding protein|uniref:ABC transporter substrate-binding protein n=1 Tax=Pengzhenrongella sp. TaxID=2888820 RepID=UPI002F94A6B5